ncbi:PREDICTED: uncharacterized protein LOC109232819 [Nicotiana attenuata]|uniref:Uncharacterized protein n=1 Tax=Nicotiana attenuata TaxID=49451 RepID=A0A1J6I1P3_NICAT|nr:PREDICTED: uncharacterized protein LOC109232819 [Nicotiana attenuata]OIS98980.1 hypothetical protein A4A49_11558 [Nicotiana attenuata]
MGDVLPLCASLRDLSLDIATVTCEKGRQSLKTVVSIFNKLKRVFPDKDYVPSTGSSRLLRERNDIYWLHFSNVSMLSMVAAFVLLMGDPKVSMISIIFETIVPMCCCIIHMIAFFTVIYWHRDMPFRLIGAKAKFMIEVIPMIIAAGLHHLLEFNYGYLALLVCCTTYFYIYAHFLHIAYDIGGIDVLLGLVMQVLGYMLNVELLVRALVLSFCFGLSFYRYMTYRAPEVPPHHKKELELPC